MSRIIRKIFYPSSQLKHDRPEAGRERKIVVAHFMVGNTAPYALSDWEEDIRLASCNGIDGFALNVGKELWQMDQVASCFEATERSGTDFQLFFSFDMSSPPSSSPRDIRFLKAYISTFALHPNYLRYKGKALVSTFAGENSLFGCDDIDSAWILVKGIFEEICPISFVPSFFIDPRRFHSMKCIDGIFNWNGCWPIHLTPDSPKEEIRHPKLNTDIEYIHNLHRKNERRKIYIASVSPWFFTHYGEDSWNKNWIYSCDDWLLIRRWKQLVDMRDDVDIVQIISWNDYGESHYVGPIKGAQPNSEAWVNGFDHTAWLHLCGYFIRLYKGQECLTTHPEPSLDDADRIYVWTRPHPRDAVACEDLVGRPKNWELTEDKFWVVISAHAPAHVLLWSSDTDTCSSLVGSTITGGNPTTNRHRIPAGLSLLSCPLIDNGGINIQLVRGGRIVLQFHPVDFVFEAQPKKYNFNAYVAMYPC